MKIRNLVFLAVVGSAFSLLAACETVGTFAELQTHLADVSLRSSAYASEKRDWGVPARTTLKTSNYHSSTPTTAPGAHTITTPELVALLKDRSATPPIVIDVMSDNAQGSIPGAIWLKGAGIGASFEDDQQTRLAQKLAEITGGNRASKLVVYCLSSECWLSYNASMRISRMGYRDVNWYRGGITSWKSAGLPTTRGRPATW